MAALAGIDRNVSFWEVRLVLAQGWILQIFKCNESVRQNLL